MNNASLHIDSSTTDSSMTSANTVLAIIGHSPLAGHNVYESLSALMVMATYGQAVQLLFISDAVHSLQRLPEPSAQMPFKSVQAMIESFEFYDLLPVWVAGQPLPTNPLVDCVAVSLNQINIQQFKAVLTC